MTDWIYPEIAPHTYLDVPVIVIVTLLWVGLVETTKWIDAYTLVITRIEERIDGIYTLNEKEIIQNGKLDDKLNQILNLVSK